MGPNPVPPGLEDLTTSLYKEEIMITNTVFPDALMRHFIGLDHMHRLAIEAQQAPNYPPFNIEQIGDDNYILSLAVAGFADNEIAISLLNGALTIKGEKPKTDDKTVYVHRGLSFREFSRTFTLAEHVQVIAADLRDGMLTVQLERQVPESAKPKVIPIGASPPRATVTKIAPEQIEPPKAFDGLFGDIRCRNFS